MFHVVIMLPRVAPDGPLSTEKALEKATRRLAGTNHSYVYGAPDHWTDPRS